MWNVITEIDDIGMVDKLRHEWLEKNGVQWYRNNEPKTDWEEWADSKNNCLIQQS